MGVCTTRTERRNHRRGANWRLRGTPAQLRRLHCGEDTDEMTEYLLVTYRAMQRVGLTETLPEFLAVAYLVTNNASHAGRVVSTKCVEWITFYVGLRLAGTPFPLASSMMATIVVELQGMRKHIEEAAKELGVEIE